MLYFRCFKGVLYNMLYKDIEKLSASDLCFHIGAAIEADMKNKKLKKQFVARQAGITAMSLYRLCKGENTSLEIYLKVLKVIGRMDIIDLMTEKSPAEPLSYYDAFKKTRKKKKADGITITKADIASLYEDGFQWKD